VLALGGGEDFVVLGVVCVDVVAEALAVVVAGAGVLAGVGEVAGAGVVVVAALLAVVGVLAPGSCSRFSAFSPSSTK
jgi:hypothetical protein